MTALAFDMEALTPETGVRAIWLLYERGQWGMLEDFGLHRAATKPIFDAYAANNVVGTRLTRVQVRELIAATPGLAEISFQLRQAYALQFYDISKRATATSGQGREKKNGTKNLSRRRNPAVGGDGIQRQVGVGDG
jgi:phage tail protein X